MLERYIERTKEVYGIVKIEIKACLISIFGIIKSNILLSGEKINKLEIGVGKSKRKEGRIYYLRYESGNGFSLGSEIWSTFPK